MPPRCGPETAALQLDLALERACHAAALCVAALLFRTVGDALGEAAARRGRHHQGSPPQPHHGHRPPLPSPRPPKLRPARLLPPPPPLHRRMPPRCRALAALLSPSPGVPAQWNYNKEFRASPEFRARSFAREGSPPDAECISYTHDRDYEAVSGVQRPAPHLASSAWCPPPPAEYDGFVGLEGRWAGHPRRRPAP